MIHFLLVIMPLAFVFDIPIETPTWMEPHPHVVVPPDPNPHNEPELV
jgi:hypothetical protein